MNDTANGTVFDRGPNKSNGTTTGSTVSIASPAVVSGQYSYISAGGAMTFDGSSTYVQLPSAGFSDFTNGFSLGVWVYPTAFNTYTRIFDFAAGQGSNEIDLNLNSDGKLRYEVQQTGGSSIISTQALTLNSWQYVSVTHSISSSNNVTIWINGISAGTGTLSLPANAIRALNYIGRSNFSGNTTFSGQMSSLSIWTTALTSAQVSAGMWTQYTGNEVGLLGYWPLSGSTSTPMRTVVPDTSFINAQVFNGTSTFVTVPSTGLADFTSGFSAGAWVYPTAATNSGRIFDFGNGSPSDNIVLSRNGTTNDLYFSVIKGSSSSGVTQLIATGAITQNTWQYLSVTVTSAGVATLYKNGVQIAQSTNTGFVPSNVTRTNNYLGKSNWSSDPLFVGQMSSLSIWNAPLSPSQIQAAANTRFDGSETNLVYYKAMGFNPPAVTPTLLPKVLLPYSTATAQVFDGVSNQITVAGTGLSDFSQGFSAGVWAYPTSTASNTAFFDFGNRDQKNDILLWKDGTSNDLRLWVFKDGVSSTLTASNAISLNAWQYFSVTVTSTGVATIYKNGVSITTSTNVGFVPNVVDRTSNSLGANNWQTSLFAGQMMGLSVWNTALSSSQVATYSTLSTPRLSGNEANLVGFWPMDGSPAAGVVDIGPKGLNGTLMGAVSFGMTGTGYNTPYAGSLTFNGSQTFVSLPGTGLSNFTSGLSAGVWVYPTAFNSTARIFDFGAGPGSNEVDLYLNSNGTLTYEVQQSNGGTITSTQGLALNRWQYVSVTHSTSTSNNVTISINGASVGTGTLALPANASRTLNYIGQSNWSGNPLFSGQMNSFSLWNTALTQAQIQSGMNSAFAGTESGLIRYWPMNETTGSTVVDHSANASSGTVMGGVVSQTTNTGITQDNLDFQSTSVAPGANVGSPPNTGWTYPSWSGIAANGSAYGAAPAPIGSQVALIQSTSSANGSMSTNLTGFAPNQVYSLSFDAAQRAGYANQGVQVSLDGNSLGTFTPSSAANSSGTPLQSAMNFDGRTSYVSLPSTGLSNFTTGFSAGVWVYPTSTASYSRFFDFGNGAPSDNILLCRSGNTNDLLFQVCKGTTQTNLIATGAITLNAWQYFSVTVSSAGVTTLYKNGSQLTQSTNTGFVPNNLKRNLNYVGKSPYANDTPFAGQMGDLSVWNTAMTSAQVSTGYNTGYQGTESSLIGLWHLGDVNTTAKGLGTSSDVTLAGNFTPGAANTSSLPFQRPLNFDGSTNYVTLGSNGLDNFTSGFSAAVWVYPTSTAGAARIFDFGNGSGSDNILLMENGTSNTGLSFQVYKGSSITSYDVANVLTLNTWQYISVTVTSGGVYTLYKNGTSLGTCTKPGLISNNVTRIKNYIGKSNWDNPLFAGQMGELSVWNTALTAAQVSTGYSTGYKGNESNLVGLWHLGDLGAVVPDSGPSTLDAGVNGNVNAVRFTSGYQRFTIPAVMPGAGPHTLTFTGTNPTNASDCTAFISNIAFTTSPFLPPSPAITYAPPAFTNASFETTNYVSQSSGGTGYSYRPAGLGWTFSNSAGYTQHALGLDQGTNGVYTSSGSGDAPPDGNYEAFLQACGTTLANSQASMSQTISGFMLGQVYDLSLFVKSRVHAGNVSNDYQYGFRSNFTVSMDGVSLGTYAAASASKWQQITIPGISPGPGSHTFTFTSTGILPLVKNGVTYTTNPDGSTSDCTILLDQIQFFNSGAETIAASQIATLPSVSSGAHNSYAAFTVIISGVKVGIQVFFDGRVNVIYGDVLGQAFEQMAQDLTQAYKATAAALSSAYTTVSGKLTAGSKLIANDFESMQNDINAAANNTAKQAIKTLKRVGKKIRNFFNYSVSDATAYYDPTGLFAQDPNLIAITDAAGGFTLQIPENPTGQLVGYGGTDTATGLYNDAIFTAVATADVLSPLTTLVNALVVNDGLSESDAISIVDIGLGIPGTPGDPNTTGGAGTFTQYDLDASGTMDNAVAGDPKASLAFAAEVKTYLLVHEMAALLIGLPGNPNNITMSSLMRHGFEALVDLLQKNGAEVDLSDPAVIASLIQTTATAAGLSINSSLSNPAAGIIARIVLGINNLENQDPSAASAPGKLAFLQRTAAFQTLADGTIAAKLTQAAGLPVDDANGINALAATYTFEQLTTDAGTTTIGNLLPPTVSIRDAHDSVGAGQNNYLDFEVSVTGDASVLLPMSVSYTTIDDTATVANGDYTSVTGILTWAAGDETYKTIRVPIAPGTSNQVGKQFQLQLSNPHNALTQFSVGVGTIDNTVMETTSTLNSSVATATALSPVTLTTAVTKQDATGVPGVVSFYDGPTLLGMRSLESDGTASLTTSALTVGTHTIHVVFSGNTIDGVAYSSSTSSDVQVSIQASSQAINFGSISDTTYGAAPFALIGTSTFGLPVSYSVVSGPASITDGVLTITGAGTVTVEATQSGNDQIEAATPVDVTFHVAPATLMVTINNQSAVYGAALPSLTYTLTGFVGADTASVLAQLPILNTVDPLTKVGTYSITASGLSDPNYTVVYVLGQLTITKAPLAITADEQTMVYGGTLPTLTYTISGLIGSDTAASLQTLPGLTTAAATSDVGAYYLGITAADPNYQITTDSSTLTITPAPLTIVANSYTISRTDGIPDFGLTYQGLVNGDDETGLTHPAIIIPGSASRNAGTVSLVPSDAIAPNYMINYVSGTLTIVKPTLTLTVGNANWYVGLGPAQLTSTFSGFLNGEDLSSLSSQPTRAAGGPNGALLTELISSNPAEALQLLKTRVSTLIGGLPSTATLGASGASAENYEIAVVAGTLQIIAAHTVTNLTPSSASPTHGETVTFSASTQMYSQIPGSDPQTTQSVGFRPAALGTIQFQVDGVNAEAPITCDSSGLASFSQSTLSRGQHTITSVYSSGFPSVIGANSQTMQVNVLGVPSETVLSTSASSSVYGQPSSITANVRNTVDPTATATGTVQFAVDGVAYGAPVTLASGEATISLPAMLAAGNHQITATYSGDSTLYDSEATALTQNVAQAVATIHVSSYSVTYDGEAHLATGTVHGFDGSSLSGLVLSETTHTNAGITTDTWTFHDASGNYQDTSGAVTNSIAQATATITVTPYTSSFDGSLHGASATAIGVGNTNLISSLDLTGTMHTNAGLYSQDAWSFHAVSGNYADASGTISNTIGSAPVVTTQPVDVAVLAGATATFTVVATGDLAPTIQWQVSTNRGSSWSEIPNATAATYSLSTVVSNGGYQYRAVTTNAVGVITSHVVTLTVNPRSLSTLTIYTTTVFTGLSTGLINLVDIVDLQRISLLTIYTATINWGDGNVDTNVAVLHPGSDGTTIHVRGTHLYAVGGSYQPLVTLYDSAGSVFTTVLGNTGKLIVGTNVSNKVSITRSSPVKNRTTGLWAQTVTMNNISGVDLTGNIDFVLIGLTAGVSLANATGATAGGANPYIRFSASGLKAGKSISLVLKFQLPTTITAFNYNFATYTN